MLAPDLIEVEDVVRISVENKMCDERGALVDTFNVPQYLVYDKMNEVCALRGSVAWKLVNQGVYWLIGGLFLYFIGLPEIGLVKLHCCGSNKFHLCLCEVAYGLTLQ